MKGLIRKPGLRYAEGPGPARPTRAFGVPQTRLALDVLLRATGWAAAIALLATGCSARPQPQPVITTQPVDPIPFGPGPTVQSRVPGGYQLLNRDLRVIISDITGDVIHFGPADSDVNLAGPAGVRAVFDNGPDVAPVGMIESRDEQTWQYIGDDANGRRWRKIYCLEGDHLYASFIVQDTLKTPMVGRVDFTAAVPAGQVLAHDFEHCVVSTPAGVLNVHGFNLEHDPDAKLPATIWIASDPLPLAADQRLGYTTDWQWQPAGGT